MNEDQIWAQLDLKAKNVCETLKDGFDAKMGEDAFLSEGEEDEDGIGLEDEYGEDEEFAGMEGIGFGDEDEDEDGLYREDIGGIEDDDDEEEEEEEEEEEKGEDPNDGNLGEGVTSLRDPSSDEDSEEDGDSDPEAPNTFELDAPPPRKRKRTGHPELDDGFFSLADFNAEIEAAESRRVSSGRLNKSSEESDSDEEEGDVDLFAPVDDVEGFEEGDDDAAGGSFLSSLLGKYRQDSSYNIFLLRIILQGLLCTSCTACKEG